MSPNSKDEALLSQAVENTGTLVSDGLTPTAALTKVAEDLRLPPGFIKIASDIYNQGVQLDLFQRGKTATDKLLPIDLVNVDQVMGNIYGTKKVANDKPASVIVAHDAFAPLPATRKAAGDVPDWFFDSYDEGTTRKTAADTPAAEPLPNYRETMRKLAGERESFEQTRVDIELTRDDAATCISKVASFFTEPGTTRLSLGDFERVCGHAFPDLDLEPVYSLVTERNPREKRAGDNRIVTGRVDLSQSPFTWISELRSAVTKLKTADDSAKQSKIRILKLEEEAGLNKTGGINDIGTIGLGTALGQSIMGKGDDNEEAKSIYSDLIDPQHTANLNSIKAKAVLSHVINDPDDPIRDSSLQTIVHKYNDIAQVAPHLARTPATLKPLLRRALQAAPQPFELQEIAGLERTLNPPSTRKSDVE